MTKGLWARCPKTGFFGELVSVLEITGAVKNFYWQIGKGTYPTGSFPNDGGHWAIRGLSPRRIF